MENKETIELKELKEHTALSTALRIFSFKDGIGLGINWTCAFEGKDGDEEITCTIPWARYRAFALQNLLIMLNQDFYSSMVDLVGLNAAIGSTTNTYAGVDRSLVQNAFFRPYVMDAKDATLTTEQIDNDLAAIFIQSGHQPNVALTHKLSEVMKNHTSGIFVEDIYCPADTIYYLNSNFVRFEYLSASPTSSPLYVDMLANGCKQIKIYPQLAIERPNACGVRKNIGFTGTQETRTPPPPKGWGCWCRMPGSGLDDRAYEQLMKEMGFED